MQEGDMEGRGGGGLKFFDTNKISEAFAGRKRKKTEKEA